ncbi:MAG: mycofactocin biosynthesis chaperone MftB [Desulfatiglandaceae bacterium]
MAKSYALAPGTQVREENFGLLFYTMKGPRLYFLSSGELLDSSFFGSDLSFAEWLEGDGDNQSVRKEVVSVIGKRLEQLKEKGVIIER